MKLNCPYCGETVPYDISLAGQSIQCSYCDKPLKMPSFNELPEELREDLRQQAARYEEKQKRKYRRKQEDFLKGLEKEERRKQKDEERQQKEEEQRQREDAARQEQHTIDRAVPALRSSAKPLGVVLVAIYSAVGAWQLLQSQGAATSMVGDTSEITDGLTQGLGGLMSELLGSAGGLPSGGLGGDAGDTTGGGSGGLGGLIDVLLALLSMASLVSVLLLAAICYGLLTAQEWSYRLTFIAYIILGVHGLTMLAVLRSQAGTVQHLPHLVAAVLVIVYFRQPHVKALFRRPPPPARSPSLASEASAASQSGQRPPEKPAA
jgi:hypothetical protein